MTSSHPSDADRERSAAPAVEQVVAAIETGKVATFAAALAASCVFLVDGRRIEGKDAVSSYLATAMPGAREVTRRQQHGAHAVVGWAGGLCVFEVRRAEVVFGALSTSN